MKNIKEKITLSIIIVCLVLLCIQIYRQGNVNIKINGNQVIVNTAQAHAILEKDEGYQDYSFLVIGYGLKNADYYVASFPAIPMGKVREISQQYGNFRKCGSAGAGIGMSSTIDLRLIGVDAGINKKILLLYKKSKGLRDFVMLITATKLRTVEYTPARQRMNYIVNSGHEDYLVKDIFVSQDNYKAGK